MPQADIVVRDYKTNPDPEYRFFLFDPEWEGMMFFKSEADRAAAAEDAINAYKDLDNGWSEEVERLCMGEVTHVCTQTNVVERPSDEELDEEGCDGEGTYWDPDIELRCDYEMLPIGNTPLVKAQKRLEWAVARKAKVLENILWLDTQNDIRRWTEFTDLDAAANHWGREMTDKIEESLRAIYRVINVQPLQIDPLREVVREIMKRSYIQGSNDHHAATVAAQKEISSNDMGREQALDLLMLLSALESAFLASKADIPAYLHERISESVEMLRGEVLT
jgi:hypothetical protein